MVHQEIIKINIIKKKRHTFDGVGEAIYFKTIVLDYAKNNKIKQLQTLSKNRGTDLSTIVDTYLKE